MNKNEGVPDLQSLLILQQKYWLSHDRISTSVNFLICKHLSINNNCDVQKIKQNIKIIDHHIELLRRIKTMRLLLVDWINCIIFNTVAINQQYKQQLGHSLSSISHSSNSSNHDVSIQIVNNYESINRQILYQLLSISSIEQIIKQISLSLPESIHQLTHKKEYPLAYTIKFLSQKFKINLKYEIQLAQKLNKLSACNCKCDQDEELPQQIRLKINNKLFLSEGVDINLSQFQQQLNKNYNISFVSIACLIDANYYNYQIKRPIFSGSRINGSQFVIQIIKTLIKSVNKNDLFSYNMLQSNRLFHLFMIIIQYRHLSTYAYWIQLLKKYFKNQREFKIKQEGIIKQISAFLRALPLQHQQFVKILKYIAEQLTNGCNYSHTAAIDIIKKLLLNRFLLNSNMFYNYTDLQISKQHLQKSFNKIRLYFYPKKVSSQQNLHKIQAIQNILISVIQMDKNVDNQQRSVNNNKNVIYQLDRSLYQDYYLLYDDFQLGKSKSQKSQKSESSSYELSFSFVKNQGFKQTKKKKMHLNIIQNTPIAYTQTSIEQKSQTHKKQKYQNIYSPTSEKSKKTDITERQTNTNEQIGMLQQLVARRRNLKYNLNRIDQKSKNKAQNRQRLGIYLTKVHSQIYQQFKQLQLDSNQIQIFIKTL